MKAKPAMDPAAAFPDAAHPPSDSDLPAALGPTAAPLAAALARFRATRPAVTTAWQFSPRCGWYQLHLLKRRRLLYLVPQQGNFRLSLLLGRKAIAELRSGPHARRTSLRLKSAKHYPEGIAFSFDRQTLDPDLLAAFLATKLTH